jgi:nucleotide-binding universal stress UspA family protein
MKVLLAVDDSPDSKAAAHFLQRIQFPAETALYLLHVNPLDEWLRLGTSGRSLRMVEQISSIRAEADTKMRNVLSLMEESFRKSGLAVHSIITDGSPGAEILRTISGHHIDLAVLGTRGLSKIAGFLLGSVSEWVLNEAPCSVLIVRGKPRPKKTAKGMNILFATDGSLDAQEGLGFVKKVGFPTSTVLTILHIVRKKVHQTAQLLTTDRTQLAEFKKLAQDLLKARGREGAKLLEVTRKALSRCDLKVKENLAFGHEAEEILKAEKRIRADLVVMGSKGLTGLRRFLLGSVSHKVARNAQCSVLVVRPDGTENTGNKR